MGNKGILKGHFAALGAYAIFGFNIVFCKDIAIYGGVSPMAMFSFRAIGAAALFWLFSLVTPREKVELKDLWKIALASLVGLLIPQVTFLFACTMTTAIDLSVLGTLTPIFTMFIAAIALKEPITVKKAGGVALSFAGVLFLIFNSVVSHNGVETSSVLGIILILINALSFATYLGAFKPLIAKYSVITFMKWMFLFSMLVSLPFSAGDILAIDYAAIPLNVVLEIAFVVVFATFVAYFLIPVGQKNIRPTLVSMYSYLQPMIAAVVSIAIGMDRLTWQKVVASVLIVTGVLIVNRSRAAQQ